MRSVLALVPLALALGCAAVPTLHQRQECVKDGNRFILQAMPVDPDHEASTLTLIKGQGNVAFLSPASAIALLFDLRGGALHAGGGGISRDAQPGHEIIFDTSPTTPRPENYCVQDNTLTVGNDSKGFSLCKSRASDAQNIVYKATKEDAESYDFDTCYGVQVLVTSSF